MQDIVKYFEDRLKKLEEEKDYPLAFLTLARYLFSKIDLYLDENFGVSPKNHKESLSCAKNIWERNFSWISRGFGRSIEKVILF